MDLVYIERPCSLREKATINLYPSYHSHIAPSNPYSFIWKKKIYIWIQTMFIKKTKTDCSNQNWWTKQDHEHHVVNVHNEKCEKWRKHEWYHWKWFQLRLLKIFKKMLAFFVHCFNVMYMCNLFCNAFNIHNLLCNAFNKKSFQLKIPIEKTWNMKKITKFQTELKKSFKNIVFLFFLHDTHDRSFFVWHCIINFFSNFFSHDILW